MIIEYPTAEDIHLIHERIVARSDKTEPGVRKPEAVVSALRSDPFADGVGYNVTIPAEPTGDDSDAQRRRRWP